MQMGMSPHENDSELPINQHKPAYRLQSHRDLMHTIVHSPCWTLAHGMITVCVSLLHPTLHSVDTFL